MTLNEHKKHAAITRPALGSFARNEWAILGAPCTVIKLLANDIIGALADQYKCAYADTSHNDDITLLPGRLANGASLEFTDQINYNQLNYSARLTLFKQKELFTEMDMVLVNGNHQQAKAQVIIIDINKQASLQKRLSQLTNVQLILLADNAETVFDFIQDALPDIENIPVYRLSDTLRIIDFFKAQMQQSKPVLNGLVLAGGKSIRMGDDKGTINWHGKQQRYYMADMLKAYCEQVYISCRDTEQQRDINDQYQTIADTFTGLGPYGAILSAFREKPDNAWLVIACDLPLVDEKIIQHLVTNRNVKHLATAYQSEVTNFPEPLITIWEPKSYPVLLQFLAQGYSCPRKVLINTDINLLSVPDINALVNVNTQEERERVNAIIQTKALQTNAS
ncbi:NTP transferase domain-containing protein [Mucilaginibacter segetis]|uniref:Probable molybdenum cofactor guanylyltransferase n=1 Tax=Mucilaginibacter segetis TaxID=2793071 RepID=A0A934UMM6_9SPHI|nr:NTP transferase domain-containing protein [Mucilaginibacter segetis]MBK0379041.1 NTP transferase domain-containing protein [Mucilaginibacter segetis]